MEIYTLDTPESAKKALDCIVACLQGHMFIWASVDELSKEIVVNPNLYIPKSSPGWDNKDIPGRIEEYTNGQRTLYLMTNRGNYVFDSEGTKYVYIDYNGVTFKGYNPPGWSTVGWWWCKTMVITERIKDEGLLELAYTGEKTDG